MDHNSDAPVFNRIFGVGLSRTGTTSLAIALLKLGFRTAHYLTRPGLYEECQAVLDTPVFEDFEKLDRLYMGSRFIYTDRDPESWLKSFRNSLLDGPLAQRQEFRNPTCPFAEMNQRVYRSLFGEVSDLSDEVLRKGYLRHRERVMDYFANRREDFLVLTIDRDDPQAIWERLSRFVGVSLPGDFPRCANASGMLWNDIRHPCKVV